jgi:hypothetical protein
VGATVVHGRRLVKKRVSDTELEELDVEDGDSTNMSYSSVSRMVVFCAERGVSEADWPIYYGTWEGDVDLDDVAARRGRLRQSLSRFGKKECAAVPWLEIVRGWLLRGEVFAVFE